MIVKPLYGHTDESTAYVVDDYPCSFRLRCKIRYYLEYKPTQGFRMVSQTTNPKVAYEKWNAPKKSTYVMVAGCLFLDEENHVHWTGLSEYSKAQEALDFITSFPEAAQPNRLLIWCLAKQKYTQRAIDTKATPYGTLSDFEVEDRKKEVEIWTRCVELLKDKK